MSANNSEVQEDAVPTTSTRPRPKITLGDCKPLKLGSGLEMPQGIYDAENDIKFGWGEILGTGVMSICFEIFEMKTHFTMACKMVPKGYLTEQNRMDAMIREIEIHRDLKHENIVDFDSYFEDKTYVYLILDLCPNKSLQHMLDNRGVITEMETKYFLKQLIDALSYLHEKKIIHRDVKPANMFLDEDMWLKLGDFGSATEIHEENQLKAFCGTPQFMAPEVVSGRGHSYEVDVWSTGSSLYALLVGKPPFEFDASRSPDIYNKIIRGDYPPPPNSVSPQAQDLIVKMLQLEPARRPNFKEILESEFFHSGCVPTCLPVSCLKTAPRVMKLVQYD